MAPLSSYGSNSSCRVSTRSITPPSQPEAVIPLSTPEALTLEDMYEDLLRGTINLRDVVQNYFKYK